MSSTGHRRRADRVGPRAVTSGGDIGLGEEPLQQHAYPLAVAHQAHPLHALDAARARHVGVPPLVACTFHFLELRLVPEEYDDVGRVLLLVPKEYDDVGRVLRLKSHGLRDLGADIDAHLGGRRGGEAKRRMTGQVREIRWSCEPAGARTTRGGVLGLLARLWVGHPEYDARWRSCRDGAGTPGVYSSACSTGEAWGLTDARSFGESCSSHSSVIIVTIDAVAVSDNCAGTACTAALDRPTGAAFV